MQAKQKLKEGVRTNINSNSNSNRRGEEVAKKYAIS
jgi:hypothetical protein